ncbi:TetR/AcrR family transcriptional regulator [Intrasporangium flavum]|uniref:TetR/AcrR family transcriptional regulator n=1 Tax=Intrasporangium flavum TaxID=1428657 RepID=UPI00096BEFAB|nr:TetR/AcrR family transcriptional regulator [Intrasporangium flavum]
MGRWEPDARGRLTRAALELYAEVGYEQTTVADLAARAGVTERTFFRHFADKREVLFDGSDRLLGAILDAVAAADPAVGPVDAAVAGMLAAAPVLEERGDFARRRAAVVAANTSLQERELLKLASMGSAVAQALRDRGVPEPAAGLAAELAVTVFRAGFERWVLDATRGLARHLRDVVADLRALTAG